MKEARKLDSHIKTRFKVIIYFLLILAIVLTVRLYFLQIMSGEIYAQEASENILRSVNVAAPRGNIYDRNGKLLVRSIPVPAVSVDPRVVAGNEETMKILAEKLNMSIFKIKEKIQKSNISYLERIILKQNIDYRTMIYFKENSAMLPGVEIINVFLREYEYGSLASHILGYTGEIDEEKLKLSQYSVGYEGGDQIGLTGVELVYEQLLRGNKGKITYEVDPLGRPKSIVEEKAYICGNDLYLTIDIDIQREIEEILAESILQIREKKITGTDENYLAPGGSIVVLDPDKDEIIAMASYPTYDPSVFTGGISAKAWAYLNDAQNHFPLNNRAVMGYAPGSVFKLVTAYAGLSEDIINTGRHINCAGTWYGLGQDFPKSCWLKSGHGAENIFDAIKNSCDIFFYQVGYELFLKNNNLDELMQKYSRIFGFGQKTGIDISSEDAGIIPDREWKKEYFKGQTGKNIWFPGDTVNMSIGQGDILVSPLQMAQAYSILINRGVKHIPHVGMEIKTPSGDVMVDLGESEPQNLNLNSTYLEIIEKGMLQVVSQGTAAGRFFGFPLSEIPVAGKTGTAEVAGKQDSAWFVCYAPVNNPEYIVVVMIEQAGGGSSSAGPVAREVLDYLFGLDNGK
ncbi:MAG: penicillin-binding protein 2 [Actinobacteria bacterium]|nr:penicillin-binding protein 2 [Actinomycetota bacterium]